MVPRERIELSASPLPRVRSTTELPRRLFKSRAYRQTRPHCQATVEAFLPTLSLRDLSTSTNSGNAFRMGEDSSNKMSREERLAAKLRENLRRRKAQARTKGQEMAESPSESLSNKRDDS